MTGEAQGCEFEFSLFFDRGELHRQLIWTRLETQHQPKACWCDVYRVVDSRVFRGTGHREVPCAIDAVIYFDERLALSAGPEQPSATFDVVRQHAGKLGVEGDFQRPLMNFDNGTSKLGFGCGVVRDRHRRLYLSIRRMGIKHREHQAGSGTSKEIAPAHSALFRRIRHCCTLSPKPTVDTLSGNTFARSRRHRPDYHF